VHVSERPQKAVAVAAGETKKRARTPKKAAKE